MVFDPDMSAINNNNSNNLNSESIHGISRDFTSNNANNTNNTNYGANVIKSTVIGLEMPYVE
jgi:hypothetical protein